VLGRGSPLEGRPELDGLGIELEGLPEELLGGELEGLPEELLGLDGLDCELEGVLDELLGLC
jgi:hypothetical protein